MGWWKIGRGGKCLGWWEDVVAESVGADESDVLVWFWRKTSQFIYAVPETFDHHQSSMIFRRRRLDDWRDQATAVDSEP